jgi:hypothetical protein
MGVLGKIPYQFELKSSSLEFLRQEVAAAAVTHGLIRSTSKAKEILEQIKDE